MRGRELHLVTQPGEVANALILRKDDFLDFVRRTTGRDADALLHDVYHIAARPKAIATLSAYWNQILAQARRHEACAFGFSDIVGALVDALELGVAGDRECGSQASVVAAVLHEAQRYGFELSVPQLSLRLHISRRTIEYAFRKHLRVAPHAYFTLRRLALCRQALLAADPHTTTVTAIATDHGFYELGRFATTYRQQFGERPSESLRKAGEHLMIGFCPTSLIAEQRRSIRG